MSTPQEGEVEMNVRVIIKLVIVFMTMTSMVAFAEHSDSAVKAHSPTGKVAKSPVGRVAKSPKRQQSRFSKEFSVWAAKQDWFALSAAAEFGDPNRDKKAEKGMSFGYSTEFVDSKGRKYILGIGLGKEPDKDVKKSRERDMVEMCATKNVMMHGKPVSTDASGSQSRSVSGTISGTTQLLCKTILKPGTEEKWILCVCIGKPNVDNVSTDNERPRNGR